MKSISSALLFSGLILLTAAMVHAQNPLSAIGDAIGNISIGGKSGHSLPGNNVSSDIVSKTANVVKKMDDSADATEAGPRNEYLLGYRVAARLLGSHKVLPMEHALSKYIDHVGQTMALGSDYPCPYRGYYFIVLDTPEINAFAAPGGFVFITTGMFKFLHNEDELAAILGHEIGHIELNHGLEAIMQSQQTKAIGGAVQDLVSETVVGDNLGPVLGPLSDEIYKSVANGYSSDLEAEADARSAEICGKLGYDASAMVGVLERFRTYKGNYGGAGYPAERTGLYIERLKQSRYIPPAPVTARTERFAEALMLTP